ncbi:MAG: porin [Robiginitomaculum sp.]
MIFVKTGIAGLLALGFSINVTSMAVAGEASETPWNLFHGAPKIKDDHGNYWKLRGRVFWDLANINETHTGAAERSFTHDEFRAARLGVEGVYEKLKFKAELDFSGGKTNFKDVNLTWKGPVVITAGQMKAGGSMEEITSSRHIAFMERGMATDGLGFDRRLGIKIAKSWDNYGISAGAYGNSIDGAREGKSTNTVLAARGYYAPIFEKGNVVHLGASVRHTNRARGGPKHSARWGLHQATEKAKPNVGDDALLFGLEIAMIKGPFHAHGEYLSENGDLGTAKGGFMQVGYFLTGENRKYKGGKFDRTKPAKPLSKGGYGALEVGARFDTFDARDAGDEKVDAYTLGLTWYPESHLRVKLNYIDANGDTFDANGLQMRLQMDW